MCSFTWETVIPSYMCSPSWETHLPNDMCSLPGKHKSLAICAPLRGKQILIPCDMCSPTWETHIPNDMCGSTWETRMLAICVPLPGKHISLVICVSPPRKHIFLLLIHTVALLQAYSVQYGWRLHLWSRLCSGNVSGSWFIPAALTSVSDSIS